MENLQNTTENVCKQISEEAIGAFKPYSVVLKWPSQKLITDRNKNYLQELAQLSNSINWESVT